MACPGMGRASRTQTPPPKAKRRWSLGTILRGVGFLRVSIMEQESTDAQSPGSVLFDKRGDELDDSDASAEVGVKSNLSQTCKNLIVSEEESKITLVREITPLSGIGFVVGELIGSGIFITPSHILNYTGSFGLSLVCWAFGAIVALAGALCYFELGMLVRKSGGEYAILLEAYSFRKKNPWVEMLGSLVSFLFTWTTVFVLRGASASIISLACARYLIRPFFIGCDVPESAVKLLALAVLSTFTCYNVMTFLYAKIAVYMYKLYVLLMHIHVCVAWSPVYTLCS